MVLTKIVKGLIHVYAKNGDLQYSYWSVGDYTDYVQAKCKTQAWCNEANQEAGYEKFTCEIVNLYGEATKW